MKKLAKITEKSPLKNKRIVITRPKDQAQDFIRMLKAQGAKPIFFPTIRIIPPENWGELDEAISNLKKYDTVIFTSVNGVKFFIQRFAKKKGNYGLFRNLRICAIGPRTAAQVEQYGLRVNIIPKEFRAESILNALKKEGIEGRRFLLPRAEKAREILPVEIKKMGGYVDVVTAYRTVKEEGDITAIKGLFQNQEIDVVTFTSSSTVKNFVELFSEENITDLIKGCFVACIGPVTAKTASDLGIRTDIMPPKYTIKGLVQAIFEFLKSSQEKNGINIRNVASD